MLNLSQLPPLSLYIHYPWCVQKCPYCDFNSHQQQENQDQAYINALIDDLSQSLPQIWGRSIYSVFIGGGTPSLMSIDAFSELMAQLRALLNLSPQAEFTLEANPGTMDSDKFAHFKRLGVNRLSIGIQSFQNSSLQALGRIHDSQQALDALAIARAAGFENINLDLMFALPGQDLAMAKADIEQAIALAPEHISYYQLTIEPNTFFASHPPALPEDELAFAIQSQGHALLKGAAYEQYEISAWSKPQKQCKHNLNYWRFGDYLGIGAGAHGKISSGANQSISRHWKTKQPKQYLTQQKQKCFEDNQTILSQNDLIFEFMLNASRLINGVDSALFSQTTGLDYALIEPYLKKAQQQGLLVKDDKRICASQQGLSYLNDLQMLFLVD